MSLGRLEILEPSYVFVLNSHGYTRYKFDEQGVVVTHYPYDELIEDGFPNAKELNLQCHDGNGQWYTNGVRKDGF